MKLIVGEKLENLGETTHVWFPIPKEHGEKAPVAFSVPPRSVVVEDRFQNVVGYYCLREKNATLSMTVEGRGDRTADPPTDTTLSSSASVDSHDKNVVSIARLLTRGIRSTEGKARRCFDWVVGYLIYDNPIRGLYTSRQALVDRRVDCGGFSTLYVALLRSLGIPARCVFGWAMRSRGGYHAWAEYFDKSKKQWILADPSVAHLGSRTKLDAGFGFINDPRIAVSIGEDIELAGASGFHWIVPLLQAPVVVSLTNGVPQPVVEHLIWDMSHR